MEQHRTKHITAIILLSLLYLGPYFVLLILYGDLLTDLEYKIYVVSAPTFYIDCIILLPLFEYYFYGTNRDDHYCNLLFMVIKSILVGLFLVLFVFSMHLLLLIPIIYNTCFVLGVNIEQIMYARIRMRTILQTLNTSDLQV